MPVFEDLIEIAKRNLVQHGTLAPIFFLLRGEEMVVAPTLMSYLDEVYARMGSPELNLEDSKTRNVYVIGNMARVVGANRVILLWDAAFRTVDPKDIKATGDCPTERPLMYPRSMRTECIIAEDIRIPLEENRTIVVPYKGGEGEPVEFLPDNPVSKLPGAAYKSRFPELIIDGYNRPTSNDTPDRKINWR